MEYRVLSKDMQDREVQILMSMLVPGSNVIRMERLHDTNAIDVYFNRDTFDQECMISFFPDELEECQLYIPIESMKLYTLYNFLNGYSTFWQEAPANPGKLKGDKQRGLLFDEIIGFWEKRFLEEGTQQDLQMRCGDVWNRIVHYSMEADDSLKSNVALLEELDNEFQKGCRKYFYAQGLADAYRAMQIFGALKTE